MDNCILLDAAINYCVDKQSNNNVQCLLQTWLCPRVITSKELQILQPFKKRTINEIELKLLRDNKDAYNEDILVAHRLCKDHLIYHCSDYQYTTKTCSNLVEYLDNNNKTSYGSIQYFFSTNTTVYAINK